MATVAGSRQYGIYMDLDDVKSYLRFSAPSTPDATDDPILQRFVGMACTKIQGLINRPVGAQEFWERHDGWSGEYIMLKETPLVELVSCVEWQSSGGPVTLVESTPANPVDGVQVDYATGRLMRTFAGYSWPRPFFPGSRNIEVTYLAGFNPVPDDIWTATVELVKHWWVNTQQGSGLRPVALGSEYDPADTADRTGLFPAVPYRVEALIADYRLPSIA